MRVKAENEMFKRTIMEKEKEQRKEYRKMREAIKKKEQQIEKQVQRQLMLAQNDVKLLEND